jgi:hypothetical protein
MSIDKRINAFIKLGQFLKQFSVDGVKNDSTGLNDLFYDDLNELITHVHIHNAWFTEKNVRTALAALAQSLEENTLLDWVSFYINDLKYRKDTKRVAVIMAGNVPMVGFHDMLCVLISGNKFVGKLSSDDKFLLPFVAKILIQIDSDFSSQIEFTEDQLKNIEAVIATGSNNSALYFDYYFGKYPNIIRKNRNSVAVLTGVESVDLWVHGEHLLFEGRKMSKSAGNVVLLDDVIAKGFDPLSLRLCFLENRYRSQMDLSWQSISAAHETIKRWRSKVAGWGTGKNIDLDPAVLGFLENDLDTPRVITYLRALEKDGSATDNQKANAFLYADQVLGLDLTRAPEIRELPSELKVLLEEREAARKAKDWARSDELRATLENAGLEISDSASGQSWSWR